MMNGPHVPGSVRYGWVDSIENEVSKFKGKTPNPEEGVKAFKDSFLSKGFTDKDIVALSVLYSTDEI